MACSFDNFWKSTASKYSSVFRENRCPPPPKAVYSGNFSHEAVTLKMRSKSSKSNKLLILSNLYRLANLVTFHPMGHEITCRQTLLAYFGGLSLTVILKIRSRSPKPIQLFIMSKCYANLVKICKLVHEILCTQAPFGSNLAVLSPALTLKNRSWSPKSNQLFIMPQCYIHANRLKSANQFMRYDALLGLNFVV